MATIKSFTNLPQSETLSKILPHESADMGWNVFVDGTTRILPIDDWNLVKDGSGNVKFYRAWSLAALLSALPKTFSYNNHTYQFMYNTHAMFYINLDTYDEDTFCSTNENLVDACYEMIIRLNELNLL